MGIALKGRSSWSALLVATGLALAVGVPPATADVVDDQYSACRTYAGPEGPGNIVNLSNPPLDINIRVFEDETWICVSSDGVGKRLILPVGSPVPINYPDLDSLPVGVATDEDFEACATTPGNEIPGTHPMVDVFAALGLVDLYMDAYLGNDELWLCYQSNGAPIRSDGLRVAVRFGPT